MAWSRMCADASLATTVMCAPHGTSARTLLVATCPPPTTSTRLRTRSRKAGKYGTPWSARRRGMTSVEVVYYLSRPIEIMGYPRDVSSQRRAASDAPVRRGPLCRRAGRRCDSAYSGCAQAAGVWRVGGAAVRDGVPDRGRDAAGLQRVAAPDQLARHRRPRLDAERQLPGRRLAHRGLCARCATRVWLNLGFAADCGLGRGLHRCGDLRHRPDQRLSAGHT